MDMTKIQVAAVCANMVRIYGPVPKHCPVRPLLQELEFGNRGQALEYAREFDERQRLGQ